MHQNTANIGQRRPTMLEKGKEKETDLLEQNLTPDKSRIATTRKIRKKTTIKQPLIVDLKYLKEALEYWIQQIQIPDTNEEKHMKSQFSSFKNELLDDLTQNLKANTLNLGQALESINDYPPLNVFKSSLSLLASIETIAKVNAMSKIPKDIPDAPAHLIEINNLQEFKASLLQALANKEMETLLELIHSKEAKALQERESLLKFIESELSLAQAGLHADLLFNYLRKKKEQLNKETFEQLLDNFYTKLMAYAFQAQFLSYEESLSPNFRNQMTLPIWNEVVKRSSIGMNELDLLQEILGLKKEQQEEKKQQKTKLDPEVQEQITALCKSLNHIEFFKLRNDISNSWLRILDQKKETQEQLNEYLTQADIIEPHFRDIYHKNLAEIHISGFKDNPLAKSRYEWLDKHPQTAEALRTHFQAEYRISQHDRELKASRKAEDSLLSKSCFNLKVRLLRNLRKDLDHAVKKNKFFKADDNYEMQQIKNIANTLDYIRNPKLSRETKLKYIKDFENSAKKNSSKWEKFGMLSAIFLGAAAGAVLGCCLGTFIGAAAGGLITSWSGPGAIVGAIVAAIAVGSLTTTKGLALGACIGGTFAAGMGLGTTFFRAKTEIELDIEEFIEKGRLVT